MEKELEKIEGISPEMLWTFLIVLVGLAGLFVLGYKVVEIFRKEHDRRTQRNQLNNTDITDRIAEKVMEKLQPELDKKFAEIDKRFANDKESIDCHTRQLNEQGRRMDQMETGLDRRVSQLENGSKALCHGMLALLETQPGLKNAQKAMRNYLIDGVYKEEDEE